LERAAGGKDILNDPDSADHIRRFGLALLGVRTHVIADTWAHQDWCAKNHYLNTYWDVRKNKVYNNLYQRIEYQDLGDEWKPIHLSSTYDPSLGQNGNFQAAPNANSLGHGWMGHLPDFSFIKYRYMPTWQPYESRPLVRDNPAEYKHAFLELCSLLSQCNGTRFDPGSETAKLDAAHKAISTPIGISKKENIPRVHSSRQWTEQMKRVGLEAPVDVIDSKQEPDIRAVLDGQVDYRSLAETRYGTYYMNFTSDLYLFAIAADYHFHFVKNWLGTHGIATDLFNDSWSKQLGPITQNIDDLLEN
jgi:hypothetical protein